MEEQLLKCSTNYMAEFHQLLMEGNFVDCSLAAEGQSLKAHRTVLSAASAYFQKLFTEEHEKDPVIIFTNTRYHELEAVLKLIYQGEVEVSEDSLAEFLNVVSFLQIKGLDCNELVVKKRNVTTCDNDNSFITFEATTIPEASSVIRKMEGDVCVQQLADTKRVVQQNLSWEGSSQTILASCYGSNVSPRPTCEVMTDRRDFENTLSCSSSACGYEFSSLITDIEFKDLDEEICSNVKIEKDDMTIRIEDEPTLEDENDDYDREDSPGQLDAKLQFEDVLSKSAVTNIGNGELFNCPSCDFETSDRIHFNVHMCHVNSQSELSHCSLSTKQSSDANNHELKHLKAKPLKCSQCPYTCRSKNHLKSHMSTHNMGKPFKCTQCTFACSRKQILIDHIRTHTGEKPYKCSQCTFACIQKGNLVIHMRIHSGEKPFKCSQCTYASSKKNNLITHMHRHTGEKPFKCSQCTYTCSMKKYLTSHMGTHTGEKPFKCSQCTYSCRQKHSLIIHMRKHTGEKPFKCSQCTYSCRQKHILTTHMLKHTGDMPFKCSQCSLAFRQKHHLVDHMRTHTGEKPFKCSQCTYACRRKQHLIKHMLRHSGGKPFKCSQCTYACIQKFDLTNHMRKHTGEKPFKCSLCTYACSRNEYLRHHMRSRHTEGKPFKCSQCTYACCRKRSLINHMRKHTGETTFSVRNA